MQLSLGSALTVEARIAVVFKKLIHIINWALKTLILPVI